MAYVKETIRTVCAVICAVLALLAVVLQATALHYIIKYHPK